MLGIELFCGGHALLGQCEQRARPDAHKALLAARATLDGIRVQFAEAPPVELPAE